MGIANLNRIRAKSDAAPNWRWVAYMPSLYPIAGSNDPTSLTGILGLASATAIGELANEIDNYIGREAASSAARMFRQYLNMNGGALDIVYTEAAQLSFPHIPAQGRFGGGTNTYYPSFNDCSAVTFTFAEDIDYTVNAYFQYWTSLVVHEDGSYGVPMDYKRPIIIDCFNYLNDTLPVFRGILIGCWPSERGSIDLTYTDSNKVALSVTFSVDSVSILIGPEFLPSTSFFTGGGSAFSRIMRSGAANVITGAVMSRLLGKGPPP